MKFFTQKTFLFKLIVSLCLILTIFTAGFSTVSNAEIAGAPGTGNVPSGAPGDTGVTNGGNDATAGSTSGSGDVKEATIFAVGGKLLSPIVDLMLALGDAVTEIIHKAVMGTDSSVTIDTGRKLIYTILSVLAAAVLIGLAVVLAGPLVTALMSFKIGVAIVGVTTLAGFLTAYTGISGKLLPDIVLIPIYSISPEELFQGHILLFDVNIFNPKEVQKASDGDYYYYEDSNGDQIITSVNNSAQELKENIAKWYYALRNLAVVALMVVLIYIGIRMLFTSIAEEKAKYKQMMTDWFVAMCLIFLMQYIMVFANNFTESIVNLISKATEKNRYVVSVVEPDADLVENLKEIGMGEYINNYGDISYPTNLMGKARMLAQEQAGTPLYIGYAICFLVLVGYTIFFLFTYAKRLLYTMFLTVIAPLVAVSYPLDKIGDGKSQAFDMWLKEYIFNLIIQPFHLLLYLVLIGNAFDLAGTNIIYSLVAIGFMIPAEKFLRKMFGFDKAATPGFLSGATGAAVTMSAISKLSKFSGKSGGGSQAALASKNGIKTNDKQIERGANSGHSQQELLESMADKKEPPFVPTSRKEILANRLNDMYYKGRTDRSNIGDDSINGFDNNQVDLDRLQKQERERQLALGQVDNKQQEMQELESEEKEDTNKEYFKEKYNLVKEKANKVKNRVASTRPGKYVTKYAPLGFEQARTTVKRATKFSAGVALGGVGAALGVGAGDPSDVVRNTSAGVYAGAAIGEGINNRISTGAGNVKQRFDDHRKRKDPAAYKQKMQEKLDKEFKEDAKVRQLYQTKLSLKNEAEVDKAIEDAQEYRKEGVTDNDLIIKAMKSKIKDKDGKQMNIGRADKTRIAAARLSPSSKTGKDKDYNIEKMRNVKGMPEWKVDAVDQVISDLNDLVK